MKQVLAFAKSKEARQRKLIEPQLRPTIEPARNYTRSEAAFAVGCAAITLIRAYDAGHLRAYRVGRRILHSGAHLIEWLESGGRTSGERRTST